jgi:hypothetical protein
MFLWLMKTYASYGMRILYFVNCILHYVCYNNLYIQVVC